MLIDLIDVNDNDPVFPITKIEAYVLENQPTHIPFFALQAKDKDHGKVKIMHGFSSVKILNIILIKIDKTI